MKELEILFQRINGLSFHRNVANSFQEVLENCRICAEIAFIPRSFKLTVRCKEHILNHRVKMDIILLNGYPGVQTLYKTGHVCAAFFLLQQAAIKIGKSIEQMWSLPYLASRNFLFVDQGSVYGSTEMKKAVDTSRVWPGETTIKTLGGFTVVEGYHAPPCLANLKNRVDTYLRIGDKDCLQLAVFVISCTV